MNKSTFFINWMKQTPFVGWFFSVTEWVGDKWAGTTTLPDGSVIDSTTKEVLSVPSGSATTTTVQTSSDGSKKLNWRNIITVVLVFVGVLLFIKLFNTLGLQNLIKKRR